MPVRLGAEPFTEYQGRRLNYFNPYKYKANRYKVQLHTHTTNSDGVDTPTALITAYRDAGYHACAITDHDFLTPDPGVAGILHIPGVEETSAPLGHILNLFCTAQSAKTTLQGIIDDILLNRALASLAHPWTAVPISSDTLQRLLSYQLTEIANSHCLGWSDGHLDSVLTGNKNIWALGVDDCHNIAVAADFDKNFVEVMANALTLAALQEALREGNFYVRQTGAPQLTISVSGSIITCSMSIASDIEWLGRNSIALKTESNVTSSSYTIQGWEGYVRVRAIDHATTTYRSCSQPILILSPFTIPDLPVTKIARGWTDAKLLKGGGVGADPTEINDYTQGARVYHNAAQSIPNNTWTILAFNSERWDTDTIHDPGDNSKLTCKTAGKYLIAADATFATNATGRRVIRFLLNGATQVAPLGVMAVTTGNFSALVTTTIWDLAVGDCVEVQVTHNSGGALDVLCKNGATNLTPEFMMQRIG